MKIKIMVDAAHVADISKFTAFQGGLKTLSEDNYEKLSKEITETGFGFALHVWESHDKLYLIDGHQRVNSLLRMRDDGYEIPEIPYCLVKAKTFDDAKRRVLQGVSQYGKIDKEGFRDFVSDLDFTFDDKFDLPDISFNLDSLEEDMVDVTGSKELDESDFSEFEHLCPKCGFEWGDK